MATSQCRKQFANDRWNCTMTFAQRNRLMEKGECCVSDTHVHIHTHTHTYTHAHTHIHIYTNTSIGVLVV